MGLAPSWVCRLTAINCAVFPLQRLRVVARRRAAFAASVFVATLLATLAAVSVFHTAHALEPILLDAKSERVMITRSGAFQLRRGETLNVETAPGLDGTSGRMSVRSQLPGSNPDWIVFALRNTSEKPITRWVTSERYNLIGSGIVWPDLDGPRLEALTPSLGFLPERIDNDRADIFQLTIDPGQTITYAMELVTGRQAEVYLWQPTSYRLKARDRELFNGIMLGIVGVLGVFLTAVFAANHKAIFPSAALVAWCVLAYLCVDFGFWHKLLHLRAEDNAVYRAATESAIAASLLIFISIFLRLGSWNSFVRMLLGVWIVAQIALVFVAVLDPRLSATFARLSFAAIGGIAALVMVILAVRGQDRALAIIPTWILFLVWVFGASMTVAGQLSGELVVSGLVSGLVLLTVILGFTVTQFAFRAPEQVVGLAPGDQSLRALAVDGAGAAVWEWHARRDEVSVSPIVETALGLDAGALTGKLEGFSSFLHPADKERFLAVLAGLKENQNSSVRIDFRMRHTGNYYRWYSLDASSIQTADRRAVQCCGLMRDITEEKLTQERLLHDAVHDSLTTLPNRELFLDRLDRALVVHNDEDADDDPRLAVILVGLDKFKSVNAAHGIIVGDSMLLTIAKRIESNLMPADTLARVGGDQFALIVHQPDPRQLAMIAEKVRRSVRSPVLAAGQQIEVTGAVGIAVATAESRDPRELFKQAEIAMYRAKRSGADTVEIYRPELQAEHENRAQIELDLRRAIEQKQLKVAFQPIIYLPREELAGFEALMRWKHPTLGDLNPIDFVPIAEESDLIIRLGAYVLDQSVRQAASWQKQLPRTDRSLFVSVNLSGRELLRQELVQEVRRLSSTSGLAASSIQLELTETLVMDNPEQASVMLSRLSEAGIRLALDDFGTGYSSLAYLQRFPVNTVKIDRELIRAGAENDGGAAIVRSIVALSHELGKNVVAEGVEHPEDVTFLKSLGCEYAQGYYYGEAMTPRQVSELLKVVRKAERRAQRAIFSPQKSTVPKAVPPVEAAVSVGRRPKIDEAEAGDTAAPADRNGAVAATPSPKGDDVRRRASVSGHVNGRSGPRQGERPQGRPGGPPPPVPPSRAGHADGARAMPADIGGPPPLQGSDHAPTAAGRPANGSTDEATGGHRQSPGQSGGPVSNGAAGGPPALPDRSSGGAQSGDVERVPTQPVTAPKSRNGPPSVPSPKKVGGLAPRALTAIGAPPPRPPNGRDGVPESNNGRETDTAAAKVATVSFNERGGSPDEDLTSALVAAAGPPDNDALSIANGDPGSGDGTHGATANQDGFEDLRAGSEMRPSAPSAERRRSAGARVTAAGHGSSADGAQDRTGSGQPDSGSPVRGSPVSGPVGSGGPSDQPDDVLNDGLSVERLKTLPPGIAASLARLAGMDLDDDDEDDDDST